ncbi:MAG: hypothetical protein P4L52_05390 [Acidocella sp.]|nr:hypothetical protein [Acidocella sp.]
MTQDLRPTNTAWRLTAAVLAGLVVQLGVKLFHLIQLLAFQDLPDRPPGFQYHTLTIAGGGKALAVGLVSGFVAGAIARRRGALVGTLNALAPYGFYVLYYLGFIVFAAAIGGQGGFVTGMLTLAWQKMWLRYVAGFAITLAASIIGASIGAALRRESA